MANYYLALLLAIIHTFLSEGLMLPVNTSNRNAINTLEITDIGKFGLLRKERPNVPAHYHSGIDIKRPTNNYKNELIYPCLEGIVISKRNDGPYAQIIIEHDNGKKFWSVYEHIAGIKINLFDEVLPNQPIARFMNTDELNTYGWQFDHFHFEILKINPIRLKVDNKNPERLFTSFTLVCYTIEDLHKYFIDPIIFFKQNLN